MSIDFSNEQEQTFDFDFLKVAEDVMETVLDQEGCPYESQVCLVLTDNETIHKTNLEYRQIDRATDVLSFPMVDFPAPADYSVLEDDDSCFDPESGELLLGDIMISIPKAVEQAEAYGHSVKREYAFLVAHSMLHLLGYDHMVDEERIVMEQKQEKALHSCRLEEINFINEKEITYEKICKTDHSPWAGRRHHADRMPEKRVWFRRTDCNAGTNRRSNRRSNTGTNCHGC